MGQAGEREGGAGEAGAAAEAGAGGPGAGHRTQQGRHARHLGAGPTQRVQAGGLGGRSAKGEDQGLYIHAHGGPVSRDVSQPLLQQGLAGQGALGPRGFLRTRKGSPAWRRGPERRSCTPSVTSLLSGSARPFPLPGLSFPDLPPEMTLRKCMHSLYKN